MSGGDDEDAGTAADVHLWQQWLLLWLTHLAVVVYYHQAYVGYHFSEVLLALSERRLSAAAVGGRHRGSRRAPPAADPLTGAAAGSTGGVAPWLYRMPVVVGGMAVAMLLQASALATVYQRQRRAGAAVASGVELGCAFVAHTAQLLLMLGWGPLLFGARQMRAHALVAVAAFAAFVTAALCWALTDVLVGLLYLGSGAFHGYYMLCAFQFSALDAAALRDTREPLADHRLQLQALERRLHTLERRPREPTPPPPLPPAPTPAPTPAPAPAATRRSPSSGAPKTAPASPPTHRRGPVPPWASVAEDSDHGWV